LKSNGDENKIIYLIGNKSDLNDMREVHKDEAMSKAQNFNIAFMETSALNGDNINKIFMDLIEKVYINFYMNSSNNNKKDINKGIDLNKDNKKKAENNNNENHSIKVKNCC